MLFVFRLMGKREVGELSLLDFAVYVLIAEVASLAIDNLEQPLMHCYFTDCVIIYHSIFKCAFYFKK